MIQLFKLLNNKYKGLSLLAATATFFQVIIDLLVPSFIAPLTSIVLKQTIPNSNIVVDKIQIIYKDWFIQTSGETETLWLSIVLMLVFSIIGIMCGMVSALLASKVAVELSRVTRRALFDKIQRLSMSNINKFSTSSLLTRITNDVTQTQNLTITMLRIMIRAPFLFVGGLIFCLLVSTQLSLNLAFMIPMMIIVIGIFSAVTVPLFIKNQKIIDAINKESRENILGARVIKSFNLEKLQDEKFVKINNDWLKNSTKAFSYMNVMLPLIVFITNISMVLIVVFGKIATNNASGGSEFTVFIQYIGYITGGLIMSVMVIVIYIRSKISAKRINEVLNEIPDIKKNEEGLIIENPNIKFDNVSFKYNKDSEENALSNISFELESGKVLGIIGPTGSGKSTLVSLISRSIVPSEGKIYIDDKDINEIQTKDLNEKVAEVLQQNILFSGTIKSNLLFGKEDATEQEIQNAIEIACAKDFIYKFEDNLNHKVEQRGKNLSGGQKQRLSIARSIIRNPKILILDDSTSALDAITDVKLRENIKNKMKGTTTIIVAQKVNSIKNADKILVLDNGKIVGLGTHNELSKKCELYKEIVASQLSKEEAKNV